MHLAPRHWLAPLVLAALASSGCASSVHEVQSAGYSPATNVAGAPRRGVWIHARAEQGVVLGITDNTDYVDRAFAQLSSQCPGDIVGLTTRYSTNLGFLSYRNVIDVRAMCLR